jgi:hypothetical protein
MPRGGLPRTRSDAHVTLVADKHGMRAYGGWGAASRVLIGDVLGQGSRWRIARRIVFRVPSR